MFMNIIVGNILHCALSFLTGGFVGCNVYNYYDSNDNP